MLDPICKVFGSHEAADEHEREYHASLSGQERLELLLEIVAAYREAMGEPSERFERVHRIIELSSS